MKKKGVLVLSLKKNTFAAVTSKGSAAQEWGIQVSVSNAESKGVGKNILCLITLDISMVRVHSCVSNANVH